MPDAEHSIARRTAYATSAQVISVVAGFASAIVTARLLGASGRGVLTLAGLVTTLVIGTLSLGIGPALSFLMGKHRYSQPTLTLASAVYAAAFGVPAAAGLALLREPLLGGVLKGLSTGDLYWVAAGLPAAYGFLFVGQVLIGAGRIRLFSAMNAANALLYPVAVIGSVLLRGPDVHVAVEALAIASWAVALIAFAGAGGGRGADMADLAAIAREAFPFGVKVWLGQALYLFYLRADSFFLNYYGGVAAVGVYSIAVTLAEKIWILAGAAAQSIYRDVARRTLEDATHLTMRAARLTLVFALFSGAALAVVSPLIPVVFGAQFAGSVVPLLVLLPGIALVSVGNVYNSFFMGQLGRPGTCSAVSAAMMVVSLVLYVTLIPPLGAVGAAAASSASYSVSLLAWLVLFPRATGARPVEMIVPTRDDLAAARRAVVREIERVRSPRRATS